MKVLVTGAAGFIGSHTVARLVESGHDVLAVDVVAPDCVARLQRTRMAAIGLSERPDRYACCDILDVSRMSEIFERFRPSAVIHLAALAGVRQSVRWPERFRAVNVNGTENVLACCRRSGTTRLVFASSSSVYGNAPAGLLANEAQAPGTFLSPYARTKWDAEELVRSAGGLRSRTILRLFTVYGPRGRPDMMPWLFASALSCGESVELHAGTSRDFTYVSDVVSAIEAVLDQGGSDVATYNVAAGAPCPTERFLSLLARELRVLPATVIRPCPAELPVATAGDSKGLRALGWRPRVDVEEGVACFASWFREFGASPRMSVCRR